jgi:hypothetical protein
VMELVKVFSFLVFFIPYRYQPVLLAVIHKFIKSFW